LRSLTAAAIVANRCAPSAVTARSNARNRLIRLRPKAVTFMPPPLAPPTTLTVARSANDWFISSTSSYARR